MSKLKKMFKQWRFILLLIALFFAYLSINPQYANKGLVINSVTVNSTAALAGIGNPGLNMKPTDRERILALQSQSVNKVEDFFTAYDHIPLQSVVRLTTNQQEYTFLKTGPQLGVAVSSAPQSNLRKGLDLQGGTRAVLKPQEKISEQETRDLISTMEHRLNVYGLSDLSIRDASDLEGNRFIIVEIAGVSKDEVRELLASQGKFEAKIGNRTVFEGGNKDITFVCRTDGTCSRIVNCGPVQGAYLCTFEFEITLSGTAAQHHADITKDLGINVTNSGGRVLDKTLDFYLDNTKVDSLQIAADLKGQQATRVTISGPGIGKTQQEALDSAIQNRNKLQTVLITGSLSTKLDIVKLDSISPTLGETFTKNAILIGILATIAVALVIYVRYRVWKIVIPIMVTVFSEIFLILGLAALFRYNLDVAAIAGILASVGTGVDDQIVITDEILFGGNNSGTTQSKIKKAFFVIMAAYFVTVAAMLPLVWAGAGLLVGFALTTIVGVTVGVLITRPAYAAVIKVLMDD